MSITLKPTDPLNPFFKDIFLQEVFKRKRFDTPQKFDSQVVFTGMSLAVMSFHGPGVVRASQLCLVEQENVNRVQQALGISGIPLISKDELPLIYEVLNQKRTIKWWWQAQNVSLFELAPWDFYGKTKKLAEKEGASLFLERRRLLSFVIEKVFIVQIRILRNLPMDLCGNDEFKHFPKILTEAWDEQIANRENSLEKSFL